jgi:hypothetical protein
VILGKITALILILLFHEGAIAMEEDYRQEIKFIEVREEDKELFRWQNSLFAMVDLAYFPKEFAHTPSTLTDNFLLGSYKETENTVLVEFVQSQKNGVLKEQYQAYRYFLENEKHILEKVKPIIYSFYKEIHPVFVTMMLNDPAGPANPWEIEAKFPTIIKGDELRDRFGLVSIYIYPPREGVSTILLYFGWTFAARVEVAIRGDEVIYVDDSFIEE